MSGPAPSEQPSHAVFSPTRGHQSNGSPTRPKRTHEAISEPTGSPRKTASDDDVTKTAAVAATAIPIPSTPSRQVTGIGASNVPKTSSEGADSGEEDDSEPGERIPSFDWEELESRYHEAMRQQGEREQQIYRDFDLLMGFFQQWVNSSRTYEVDRTYKRLRTRMAHVQHSEQQLEERQQHYDRVVQAFQSALNLLNGR